MVEQKVDYGHIAEKLAIAIEQAMWSGNEFDQQAHELCVVADALKQASAKLWADGKAAKARATILELLATDVGDADDGSGSIAEQTEQDPVVVAA